MSSINEKTHLPLSLVLSALGFVGFVVFAWAVLSSRVDAAAERLKGYEVVQDLLLKQQAKVSTQLAVIDAKQSTTIERVDWLSAFLRDNLLLHPNMGER